MSRTRSHCSGVGMWRLGLRPALPGHHFDKVIRRVGSPKRSLDLVICTSKCLVTSRRASTHVGASRALPHVMQVCAFAMLAAPHFLQIRWLLGTTSMAGATLGGGGVTGATFRIAVRAVLPRRVWPDRPAVRALCWFRRAMHHPP